MARAETPVCDFGEPAIDFSLPGVDGQIYNLADIEGPKGTLIIFMCNHCPYVKGAIDRIIRDARELKERGIGVVAINSNDAVNFPEDSYGNMKKWAAEKNFPFPYLFDETQDVARAYEAVCTPDFFGYNSERKLQYRGRIDEGGKEDPGPDARRDLFEAMKQIAETGEGPQEQVPSIGCSIKWKNP